MIIVAILVQLARNKWNWEINKILLKKATRYYERLPRSCGGVTIKWYRKRSMQEMNAAPVMGQWPTIRYSWYQYSDFMMQVRILDWLRTESNLDYLNQGRSTLCFPARSLADWKGAPGTGSRNRATQPPRRIAVFEISSACCAICSRLWVALGRLHLYTGSLGPTRGRTMMRAMMRRKAMRRKAIEIE